MRARPLAFCLIVLAFIAFGLKILFALVARTTDTEYLQREPLPVDGTPSPPWKGRDGFEATEINLFPTFAEIFIP
jgi:hypothetical protein